MGEDAISVAGGVRFLTMARIPVGLMRLCAYPGTGFTLAVLTTALCGWSCVLLSWVMLFVKTRHVRDASPTQLYLLEGSSVLLACVGHWILFRLFRSKAPPALVVLCVQRGILTCGMPLKPTRRPSDEEGEGDQLMRGSASSTAASVEMHGADDAGRTGGGGNVKRMGRRVEALGGGAAPRSPDAFAPVPDTASRGRGTNSSWWLPLVPLVVVVVIHTIVHHTIPAAHRQSQEIVLALARCAVDGVAIVLEAIGAVSVVLQYAPGFASGPGAIPRLQRLRHRIRVVGILSVTVLLVYGVLRFAYVAHSVETIPHLRLSILGDPIDPCEAEGMMLNPMLGKSWAWPAIHYRRLFNFYMGSQDCHGSSWRSIAFLDEETETLVVSASCPDGSAPHVFLARPENSELNGRDDFYLPEVRKGNKQYHKELEELYGTPELAAAKGVVVHRDPTTKLITGVELAPGRLLARQRQPASTAEQQAREQWPSNDAIEVPLGETAAFIVHCPASGHEEMFMYPMTLPDVTPDQCSKVPRQQQQQQQEGDNAANNEAYTPSEPAGNVLLIVVDSVSRQEVVRSLEAFTAWMRRFKEEASEQDSTGHLVIEPLAQTTLGLSTAGNLCPMLTGITSKALNLTRELMTGINYMNRTLFNAVKAQYGDGASTSLACGYCHDMLDVLFGSTGAFSGRGGRAESVDYYTYEPMCHLEYSGLESNFQGPYSIVKRCIDGRYVAEHMLDYTGHLLRQQLKRREAVMEAEKNARGGILHTTCPGTPPQGKYFFDVTYLIDGHEGTHGAIALVDGALTHFMDDLQNRLHFFDDPLNTLIFVADHGNHMGHYYELTNAGRFERTTPAVLYVVHPEVLRRVDARKGRQEGESMANFLSRTKRFATPLDMYMTMADIAGVRVQPYEGYSAAKVPPSSLFDPRSGLAVEDCKDVSTAWERYTCSLTFCVDKRYATEYEYLAELMGKIKT